MSIEIKKVQCPYCGASVEATGLTESVTCPYCDQKIIINNENEYVYREIKDAEIRKTDAEYQLELKRLEIAEKERLAREKKTKYKIIASIILGIIVVISFFFTSSETPQLPLIGFICLISILYIWLSGDSKRNSHNHSNQ